MTIHEIVDCIGGQIVAGTALCTGHKNIEYAFASDLMSDVLRQEASGMLLLTGLSNLQTIRTAEMADISCIVFVRGKRATHEMITLANDNGMVLIETPYSMFRTSGLLYGCGLKALF